MRKKEIEASMARTVYTLLAKETEADYRQARDISQFILARIEDINDHAQMLTFLEELATKWPMFESLRGLVRMKVSDVSQSQEKLKQAQASLKQVTPN